MAEPVSAEEQPRRDKAYAECERRAKQRLARRLVGFTNEWGQTWPKPSDIFFKEGFADPEPPTQRRRKSIRGMFSLTCIAPSRG